MSKAIVFENSGKIVNRDIQQTESNSIKVTLAGLCGTDKHLYNGELGEPGPFVLGHELIGIVHSLDKPEEIIGEDIKVGDRVTMAPGINCNECVNCIEKSKHCTNRYVYGFTKFKDNSELNGAFAEFVDLKKGTKVFKVPEGMSDDRALFIELMACAVGSIEKLMEVVALNRINKVLIVGSSSAGICNYIAADFYGLDVYITDINNKSIDLAKKCGIKNIILDMQNEMKNSFDVVIDCAGTKYGFKKCLDYIAVGGYMIEFGAYAPSEPINNFEFWKICTMDLTIRGFSETMDCNFPLAIRILQKTTYKIEEVITDRFSVTQVDEIAKNLSDYLDTGKAVIKF